MGASDDYVGHQINCPTCHAVIVVPANPAAPPAEPVKSSIAIATPPGMPPPPAPPKVGRLAVSALNAPQAHAPSTALGPDQLGSAGFQAHVARKPKKSHTGLIAGVAAVVLIGGSAYLNKDWLSAKWKAWRGPTAAEIAAANKPPPPEPELSAGEIMQKVAELYGNLPNYSSTGRAIAVLDLSAISPAQAAAGPQPVSYDLSLKMSRALGFRIDMAIPKGTSNVIMTGGWSAGNGDWLLSNHRTNKLQSHDMLFSRFGDVVSEGKGVSMGMGEIVRLFINDTSESLGNAGIEWTRQPDVQLNGQSNYVLAGTVKSQNVLLWVNRNSFLIPQTQVILQGKTGPDALDDDAIKGVLKAQNNGKEPTYAQINNYKRTSKISGTVIESFPNIQTSTDLAAADLQPGAAASFGGGGAPGQGPGQGRGQGPPGRAPGAGGGRASQIANGANRRGN
jgi:hypothetical protein